ncbi:Enoyl-CoA hydratase [Pseudonocardia sp. Ae168_Ps1]|uniref:enoyl-CoA hydratase-related protein n=1 Tax=unclassified Pseudonocardia TaxID=2619320 RepID=UPI00094ACEFE|nr:MULTISPECIES: enoyl-CoA hydratase-related protein [unclassified Pseudonocardia]OLL75979.1 Enoyl-CoA hydratase [Pseudonocardia sp. Ae150A_Ps1]OLL81977.1 Enoyl-CoA hydratase [Pseudonocardia sp. Ae168_Ps1]OLL83909.1 Enoyl-CoA hydratase [Pseudonocardia sp. Ae263_Ps1]OLL96072.1 Enoyl-CoA hydratase [Pseudonocardia sp. Ae356_Ps1]
MTATDTPPRTQIRYEITGATALITLDRPDRLNAFTATMAAELVAAFDTADADDAVRAVVLTGAGRGFCAGADLERGTDTFSGDSAGAPRADHGTVDGVARDLGGVVALRIAASRKPVITAVNGAAVGVGATMTLPSDVRIAGDTARFGFVFARRGLVPEAASTWFLPRIVGISRAMEWVSTGRVFDAGEALAGGLVSRVVPTGELLDTALSLAAEIAGNTSPASVALSRKLLWGMLGAADPWEAHRIETLAIDELGRGGDVAEGVSAFLEKRPATFGDRIADRLHLVPDWPAAPEPATTVRSDR